MRRWVRKHLVFLITISVVFITVLTLSVIRIPYDLTSPGSVNEIEKVIDIKDASASNGSYNTISVYSSEKVSILKYLLSFLHPSILRNPSSTAIEYDYDKMIKSGTIQKNVSITNALIAGYTYAKKEISYKHIGIIVDRVTVYAPNNIEIGDIIVKFNNQLVNEDNFDTITQGSQEEFSMEVIRNNQLTLINSSFRYLINKNDEKVPYHGITYYDYYEIDQDNVNPSYTIHKTYTLGPSGGLMQAMMIVDNLLEEDLTMGLKIAGTGEISASGKVSEIGGMYQKIFTAYYDKVDICFVPVYYNEEKEIDLDKSKNYKEALRAYKDLNKPNNLKIVPVATLDEAITYLLELNHEN